MSAVQQPHLIKVLQSQIDKIVEAERSPGYGQQLKEHLSTVLAFERDHRTRGGNIKEKVTGQVEALATSLTEGTWQPESDA